MLAVEALRILEGTPLYGVDISEKTLAQETGQMRALNFNKGCYLGQEIVERIRSRASVHRGIRQFLLDGAPATAGTQLFTSSEGSPTPAAVGELTSVAQALLPDLPGPVALGIVRVESLDRPGASGVLTYAGGSARALPSWPLTSPAANVSTIGATP
jgi:folate-binding protein YgfZ